MDFTLPEEQQIFFNSVRKLAEKNLAKDAIKRAKNDTYPWDVSSMFAQQGLLGITISEEIGAIDGTPLDAILAIQAVADFCPKSMADMGIVRSLSCYAWKGGKLTIK